jgi:hypothetical protein
MSKTRGAARRSTRKASAKKEQYCLCHGVDDGETPMILCSSCEDWFHFKCVDLSEDAAADISESRPCRYSPKLPLSNFPFSTGVYVCPTCTESTSQKIVRECLSSILSIISSLYILYPVAGSVRYSCIFRRISFVYRTLSLRLPDRVRCPVWSWWILVPSHAHSPEPLPTAHRRFVTTVVAEATPCQSRCEPRTAVLLFVGGVQVDCEHELTIVRAFVCYIGYWEGDEALEGTTNAQDDHDTEETNPVEVAVSPLPPSQAAISESEDEGSEDDYVDDTGGDGKKRGEATKVCTFSSVRRQRYVHDGQNRDTQRRSRRVSTSDSESDKNDGEKKTASQSKRERRQSTTLSSSPPPSSALKRKYSENTRERAKKKRTASTSSPPPAPSPDDPARKYCRGKFTETFTKIFLRYPHIQRDPTEPAQLVDPTSLTDEEKSTVEQEGAAFAAGVEQAVFELYEEPDKHGKPSVGPKYKYVQVSGFTSLVANFDCRERFRTITFNLSHDDRVTLHQRIAGRMIGPRELATMSSTALASEEIQASIAEAERESLAQTILPSTNAIPRAKLTHKGLQDIEDVHGDSIKQRNIEEEEEEERRERERLSRLRPSRKQSTSIPPESPMTPQVGWGAPPPLPLHLASITGAQTASSPSPVDALRSPLNLLFPSLASDNVPQREPELNLADLINIDDEPQLGEEPTLSYTPINEVTTPASGQPSGDNVPVTIPIPGSVPQGDVSAPAPPSFNLSAIWSGDEKKDIVQGLSEVLQDQDANASPSLHAQEGGNNADTGESFDDRDFDMLLDDDDDTMPLPLPEPEAPPPALKPPFVEHPTVWTGTVSKFSSTHCINHLIHA